MKTPFELSLDIILIVAISALIFILVRSIFLWYWKINTIVENQEKQNLLLEYLLRSQMGNDKVDMLLGNKSQSKSNSTTEEFNIEKFKAN